MHITATSVTGSGTNWRLRIDTGTGYHVREFRTRAAAEAMRQEVTKRALEVRQARSDLKASIESPTYSKAPGATHRTGDR